LVFGGGAGGKRLTPDDAQAIVIFRHFYGMDRYEVGRLPAWERAVLLAHGRVHMGYEQPDTGGGAPSEADILSNPGVGW
jgi:hypothetical protein